MASKILVVDDDTALLEHAKMVFAGRGLYGLGMHHHGGLRAPHFRLTART